MRGRTVLTVAVAVTTVLVGLTGCSSSGADTPDTPSAALLALPADAEAEAVGGGKQPAFEPSDVHLAVGRSVGMDVRVAPLPHGWRLADGGDTTLLHRDDDAKQSTCPPKTAGCGHTVRQSWTATAAGSTTLTWRYVDFATCKDVQNPATCKVLASKDVRVTVG
ncbi:hypothetical protein ACFP3U_10330 [Kitasatospora misakiensis]|uniref:Proteinase inhibitor I42 chagasin domain-containing protein n=1 Tax=Kitasatospora misakiensis TaxID=67330 RepID=A0ABW0WYM8_9ACTN